MNEKKHSYDMICKLCLIALLGLNLTQGEVVALL